MPPANERPPLTKILATLGPATDDRVVLRKVAEAGATLFRLNFSHGSFDEHARRLRDVRDIAAQLDRPIAVVGDLPGPKIRLGLAPAEGIVVYPGQDVIIDTAALVSAPGGPHTPPVLACGYGPLAREVQPGQRVLINDGAVRMLAIEPRSAHELVCRVTVGGLVTSRKGVNLPDSDLTIEAITPRDLECLEWAIEHALEFLALSFVRRADDIDRLRERMSERLRGRDVGTALGETILPGRPAHVQPGRATARIPIIAKIETPQAVTAIDDILQRADAIMVARGDLGVEMDVARVPMIQKSLARAAHDAGRPCIVATQMLESMIENASPTRAEVSDVANAILDGADAVMLSGETAVGKHPVLAVDAMRRVALATEASAREMPALPRPPEHLRRMLARIPALAHGAWQMARDVNAALIAVWSQDGGAARYLSRHAFGVPILAFSSDPIAVRRMSLLYSVMPTLAETTPVHRSDFARMVDEYVLRHGWGERGQQMVLIAGKPLDDPASTNTAAIRTVGELTEHE